MVGDEEDEEEHVELDLRGYRRAVFGGELPDISSVVEEPAGNVRARFPALRGGRTREGCC